MADELADDPKDWPTDPYALLGVGHGIDARELRKRYNALIRRFKPEQYPEQFRRIREAYDQVLMQEQWRRFSAPLPPRAGTAEPLPRFAPKPAADPRSPAAESGRRSGALDRAAAACVRSPRSWSGSGRSPRPA